MAVFSDMQVKQETTISDALSANHSPTPEQQTARTCTHDMQCLTAGSGHPAPTQGKNSPYSLWAEYFDNFPIVTEFDLRSSATTAGSTGTSIASSSSSSENWPSPGSGSPFSDCEHEDSAFLDEHSVPTSVIDEIVQTLKMDGYNFDHLGDGMIEHTPSFPVKQEQESATCYIQAPVYECLNPPKHELYLKHDLHSDTTLKYNSTANCVSNNNNIGIVHTNAVGNNISVFDQSVDGKWSSNTGSLPSMSISLQQIQQHTTQIQQQPIVNSNQNHPHLQLVQQPIHDPQQLNYALAGTVQDSTVHTNYTTALFPGSYTPLSANNGNDTGNIQQQYKYMNSPPVTLQPPPLIQTCEKSTETKTRRRRSTNSSPRGEKPHLCNECGAAFKLSANLKQHQVIHTGEKPFTCDICKAMFTRLSSLKTHHRLHTGEKPHVCPYCSAAFADRSAMKAHKRIHTGERPYKCGVCLTSFTQLSHLNAHKRTHTGEKPYACLICGTTFKQLGHLKRHEKSHVCNRI